MADANTDTFGVLGTGAYSTYSSGTAAPAASKGGEEKEKFAGIILFGKI
ncbi:hypothetical protein FACS1894167_10250 [Synergistales bacterium]|nr:hypothetical protein FACS1894167_10250 [Synergistales bacterium]